MTITLKVSNTNTKLYEDDKQREIGVKEDVLIEYKEGGKRQSLSLTDLDLDAVYKLVQRKVEFIAYLRPNGRDSNRIRQNTDLIPLVIDLERSQPKSLQYTVSYTKESPRMGSGVSDYSYLSDFMPAWSTARKFPWSNHARVIEPFFTSIKALPGFIRHRMEGYDASPSDFTSHLNTKTFSLPSSPLMCVSMSEEQESKLISVDYYNDNEMTLDFGYQFNVLYAKPLSYEVDFEVMFEGEYNSAFFTERVSFTSAGVVKLKAPFHKLHNIIVIPSEEFDHRVTGLQISNYLDLNSFQYKDRPTTDVNFTGASLKLVDKVRRKEKRTFNFALPNADGYFLTEDDHIIARVDTQLYAGRLDAKINLPIRGDISYNNSKFIEECKVGTRTYDLELFLDDYLTYADQDVMAVRVETSSGKVFYLDGDMALKPSDEPIYLDSSITRDSKSVTLTVDLIDEYVAVRLEDYNRRYYVSHLICEPTAEFYSPFNLFDLKPELMDTESEATRSLITFATPLIIDDKLWVKYNFETPEVFSALMVPFESNLKSPQRVGYQAYIGSA